jgi:hypothetical protein
MKTEDMDVFKLGHETTLKVYRITSNYQEAERYRCI